MAMKSCASRPSQGETELTTLVDNTGSSDASYTDTSATTPGERYIYRSQDHSRR